MKTLKGHLDGLEREENLKAKGKGKKKSSDRKGVKSKNKFFPRGKQIETQVIANQISALNLALMRVIGTFNILFKKATVMARRHPVTTRLFPS